MAEEGRFAIDDYLVYQPSTDKGDLIRLPTQKAEYTLGGKRFRLCWVDMEWTFYPVGDHPLGEGVEKAAMVELCCSGDIGYVPWTGHFHPNKPPGSSFLALPGYFIIWHVEKWFGINPDHWWILDVNAWLVSVCSVALISALGCVLFFRLALDFAEGALLPALLATVTFAFGTTFFPFSTLLFDHNLTASLLVAAFYFLRIVKKGLPETAQNRALFLAGLCAGLAAITNYIAAVVVIFLGIYALLADDRTSPNWRLAILYSIGVIPPFLLICWYGWACFGSPFKLSTDFQNPLFKDTNAVLGMFGMPSGWSLSILLVSPFRGLFYFSPVLIMGVVGIVVWLLNRKLVAEARLCLAISVFFYLVTASFNGYHGGYAAGPRYLIPGIPFLALPLAVAFSRWRVITSALALVSICANVLLTATDAQNPVGVGGHTRAEGKHSEWTYDLIGEYAWPLFVSGRAWPLLHQQIEMYLDKEREHITTETDSPAEQKKREGEIRSQLMSSIDRAEASPFLLGSIEGPVSVNPMGPYEGLFTYQFFPPRSPQCVWASFNLGEFLWPQSRWSLLPLLLISGGLCFWAARQAKAA